MAGGWRGVRTEGKVKRLMEAMVKIVGDVDKVGVKVTATLDSRVEGSDRGLVARVNISFRWLRLGPTGCAANRSSEDTVAPGYPLNR